MSFNERPEFDPADASSIKITEHRAPLDITADPQAFFLNWSQELSRAKDGPERKKLHELAANVVSGAIEVPEIGNADLLRTWLRRLAETVSHDELTVPLPASIESAAQAAIHILFRENSADWKLLRELKERGEDPFQLVTRSPKSAGGLRELGGLAKAFRGTGILALENPDQVSDLLEFSEMFYRNPRHGTVPEQARVTRDDLKNWADTGAGGKLPALIRRLVIETGNVSRIHFSAGTGSSSGGWDGVVRAESSTAFVPAGLSAWELSTEKNANAKAEKDYAKRNAGPDGALTKEVTYVQISCRPWTKSESFATTHTAEGKWKEVRAYNVDDLETWLEHAPTTSVWLSEELGRPISGIQTADQWWESWVASTVPPISSSIVLAGRESSSKQLLERLKTPGTTTIGGDVRVEEVRAFVAAVFLEATIVPDSTGPLLLFLDDPSQAKTLLRQPGSLSVLVPDPGYAKQLTPRLGHHVIVPAPGSDRADIVLPPVEPDKVAKVLEASGIQHSRAEDLGALARRSLLALRRQLALKPFLHQPSWAAPGASKTVRRALVAHSWNQAKIGDREAISALMERPYSEVEESLREMQGFEDDPLMAIVDEWWHVVSPMDSWLLLGPQINGSDLEKLRALATEVLLEPDPVKKLRPEDRWRASLDGVTRKFSNQLSRGVASSLALLGSSGASVRVGSGQTGTSIAESIVWQLLDKANRDESSETWMTISPFLPILGEAAPSVVLEALGKAFSSGGPFSVEVFADGEMDDFGSLPHSPHTDVLWALETMVWSSEHFDAAVNVVAQLAQLDPGGRWANRPIKTLQNIFCPWHPNTVASVEQRLASLSRIRKRFPGISWPLLVSLLPNAHGFQMVHRGPKYRDWKASEPIVTRGDYARVISTVSGWLIEDLGTDEGRWVTLIQELNDLPLAYRQDFLKKLRQRGREGSLGTAQEPIWTALRKFISTNREFRDAKWALPADEVDQLNSLAEELAPLSAEQKHEWLFALGPIDLGDPRRRDDYQSYIRTVAERRTAAVSEVLRGGDLNAVISFSEHTEAPGEVGAALQRATNDTFKHSILRFLEAESDQHRDFAFGYFVESFKNGGWTWMDRLLKEERTRVSPSAVALLLRSSWDPIEASKRAEAIGGEYAAEYWKSFTYVGLGADFPEVIRFSAQLVAVGRSAAALDLLALYVKDGKVDLPYAESVASAFEAFIETPDDPETTLLSQFDIQRLLKAVSVHRHSLGVARAIRIEWYFLPMLGHEPNALTLHKALAEDPKFFVQIITLIYGSEKEEITEEPTPTEERKAAAENAFRLLLSWSLCPGTDDDKNLDPQKMRSWVTEARNLLVGTGREALGDEQIGQALESGPSDPDGTPCAPIRELIEELRSDNIDRGFEVHAYNRRGVVTKSLDEGGRQEWALAAKYGHIAESLRTEWPRTAAIFRRLRETYEAQARREDAEAERRRRGLGL
jgi:hypothetical protein